MVLTSPPQLPSLIETLMKEESRVIEGDKISRGEQPLLIEGMPEQEREGRKKRGRKLNREVCEISTKRDKLLGHQP